MVVLIEIWELWKQMRGPRIKTKEGDTCQKTRQQMSILILCRSASAHSRLSLVTIWDQTTPIENLSQTKSLEPVLEWVYRNVFNEEFNLSFGRCVTITHAYTHTAYTTLPLFHTHAHTHTHFSLTHTYMHTHTPLSFSFSHTQSTHTITTHTCTHTTLSLSLTLSYTRTHTHTLLLIHTFTL